MATKKTKKTKTEGVDYKVNENVTLTCYNWGKRQTAKIVIANSFYIYATIMENEDGEYFLSYPSYKTKDGEYKRSAGCFDKKLNTEIAEYLEDFMDD